MFTSIPFALGLILPLIGHANHRTADRFERRVRHYFADFAGGRDVIGPMHFTNGVRLDLEYLFIRNPTPRDPQDPDDHLPFEIAYFTAFDRLLCRAGIGPALTPDLQLLPAVSAQCVPMTEAQLAQGVDDPVAAYRRARAAFHEPGRNLLVPRPVPDGPVRAFDQWQLPPRIEGRTLFFLNRAIFVTNPRVRVSARTRTHVTLADGRTREMDFTSPMWSARLRDEGARWLAARACVTDLDGAPGGAAKTP